MHQEISKEAEQGSLKLKACTARACACWELMIAAAILNYLFDIYSRLLDEPRILHGYMHAAGLRQPCGRAMRRYACTAAAACGRPRKPGTPHQVT